LNGDAFDPGLPLEDQELLARYILFRSRVRADGTLKPKTFMPHPYPDLSVTRHDALTEEEIWQRGKRVAKDGPLYGRADTSAFVYRAEGLSAKPDPSACNKQHMSIVGWPADKPSQKLSAIKIAARSRYRAA
jgi:hypothetical protein